MRIACVGLRAFDRGCPKLEDILAGSRSFSKYRQSHDASKYCVGALASIARAAALMQKAAPVLENTKVVATRPLKALSSSTSQTLEELNASTAAWDVLEVGHLV